MRGREPRHDGVREPHRAPSPTYLGLARDRQSKVLKSATADFNAEEGWGEGSRDADREPNAHLPDLRDPSSGPAGHLLPQREKENARFKRAFSPARAFARALR